METRANHVWVGVITLALLVLVVGGIVWIARLHEGVQDQYDIFFPQSVEGLGKGSAVSYNGVPAGQVSEIQLAAGDPGLVRVRISVSDHIPILKGTTATLEGSFTGVSTIQLNGGVKGQAPITDDGRDGVPEIPPRRSGLGELLSNAPQLLARLTGLTDQMAKMVSDENIRHLNGILANTDRATHGLADATPHIKATMDNLDETMAQATLALGEFQKTAQLANVQLDPNGQSLVHQLHDTLTNANQTVSELRGELADARAPTRRLNDETLPQAEAAIHDLQQTTRVLRDLTEKIDNQGAAAVIGAPKLPVYKP